MNLDNKLTKKFSSDLLGWFDQYGRHDLPWQNPISDYRVWISEIMLQQTQVKTVIPYYKSFLERFPNIEALANSKEDEVLHHWSGLGYYTRARNLHKCAKLICKKNKNFPSDINELIKLPGIGRSTAGAIIALAFKKRSAILDGNVKRVLTRYFAIPGWPGKKKVEEKLWELADNLTPHDRVNDYTQAIMDLGATICTRSKPRCLECPINENCTALKLNKVKDFPEKKQKKKLNTKYTNVYIILNKKGEVLLEKRPSKGIWAGLWSLPENEIILHKLNLLRNKRWKKFKHTFSHYHLYIQPEQYSVKSGYNNLDMENLIWYNLFSPKDIGIATPIKKILSGLKSDKFKIKGS